MERKAWTDQYGHFHPEVIHEGSPLPPEIRRASYESVLAQCHKCLMLVTLDCKRNGMGPDALKLELVRGVYATPTRKLIHSNRICGGEIRLFGRKDMKLY